MKKLLLFIATEKGYTALRFLTSNGQGSKVGCVITFKETNVDKDWSGDIIFECSSNKIPVYFWGEAKNVLADIVQKYEITGAVAISWRYLLPLTLNEYLEDRLIIFHDSLLPHYRGWAPTPTAIICGEETIGVTALFATETFDDGDIILQESVNIPSDMYIKDIIQEQSRLSANMLGTIIDQMEKKTLIAYPQDHSQATYSIWREPEDCLIHWDRSAKEVYNFVRALGTPYPGAFTYMEGRRIIIQRTEILNYDLDFHIRDVGKIWRIVDGKPEVICGAGMIQILEAKDEDDSLVNFKKVRCRLGI